MHTKGSSPSAQTSQAHIYLLDGFGLIFRSYFAFVRNPLRNPEGRNSSAIFGFFRTLFSLLRDWAPTGVLIALDPPGPTFRHARYDEYKATRDKAPDDLLEQIPTILRILNELRIPNLWVDGYEADDVIATYARICKQQNVGCRIVTSDKDLLQLVGDSLTILRPDGAEFAVLDRELIYERWGVYPHQIRSYLALVGDSSDNVPGVAGIGAKSAVQLLSEFADLDDLYANLARVESKSWRTKLENGRESAYLSYELIQLADTVPVDRQLSDLELHELNAEAVVPIFEQEGMKMLVTEVRALAQAHSLGQLKGSRPSGISIGSIENEAGSDTLDDVPHSYELVRDLPTLDSWIARARAAGRVAFDAETDSVDAISARPIGFSLCFGAGEACYIALRGPQGPLFDEEDVRERLRSLLEDKKVQVIGLNIKYDYKVLARWGITIANVAHDAMIAAWMLDTTINHFGMDALAERYLNYRTIHFDELLPTKKGEPTPTFDQVPLEQATDYAAEDADVTLRLMDYFEPLLHKRELTKLYHEVEIALIPVLAQMELTGVCLNDTMLTEYGVELQSELEQIQHDIYDLCGHEFKISSVKQLQAVLYEERGLKPIRKTKTGFSTDNATLTELARFDPLPKRVLRYRLLSKLRSTYVDALPRMMHPETGRIHTHFNINGSATGRISSTDPNLQNIPIRDAEGERIRSAFVPADGWLLMSADYAQIELVVLAHLSGDEALLRAFREDLDVHRQTGARIFGLDIDQVNSEQRRIAKTINFGVIYGMSAFRLSRELEITRAEADRFIAAYFETYSRVREFIAETIAKVERSGRIRTMLGRERLVLDINNRNRNVKMGAERIAINTPIQGSAADIIKLAMLNIHRRLQREGMRSRMLLQVHDELILETPSEEADDLAAILEEEMGNTLQLDAPLRVRIERGENWGALH